MARSTKEGDPNRSLRRASRRFEFMVHEGVPECPQPMYQEKTYGKTEPRFTGFPSDVPRAAPRGEVAAVFLIRDGRFVAEKPRNGATNTIVGDQAVGSDDPVEQ